MTPKQQKFADEYLLDMDATNAAIRAGYSPKTAKEIGYQLLHKTSLQNYLKERIEARSERTQVNADRVLKELEHIAFADLRRVMQWGPTGVKLTDSSQLSPEDAALVAGVVQSVSAHGDSIKLKMHDRIRVLELLGKHLGMFTGKVELDKEKGGPVALLLGGEEISPERLGW